jgi:tetratricopeptide (TPR) repeat protein
LSVLAVRLDERFAVSANLTSVPASFEAYQVFDQGLEHYLRSEERDAVPYFERALRLDSTFAPALRFLAISLSNIPDFARFDSVVRVADNLGDRLPPYERAWMDYIAADMSGDYPAALAAIRRAAEMAPGSKAVYNYAHVAIRMNRPREQLMH